MLRQQWVDHLVPTHHPAAVGSKKIGHVAHQYRLQAVELRFGGRKERIGRCNNPLFHHPPTTQRAVLPVGLSRLVAPQMKVA